MINITQLDDAAAQRILTTIARARFQANSPEDATQLRKALIEEFHFQPDSQSVSDGDLARQALLLLAEDPATRAAVEAIASEPTRSERYTFDGGATIALTAAVLFALRTGVDVERDKDGKWSFKLKVKPSSEGVVKKLIEKLVNYLPS